MLPKSAGWLPISPARRPVAKTSLRGLGVGFCKQMIQLTCGGIMIDLIVPGLLFAGSKPSDNAPVVFGRQAINRRFDLFHPIHAWSLTA